MNRIREGRDQARWKEFWLPMAAVAFLLLCFFWQTRHSVFGVQEEYDLFYIVQKGDFSLWLHNVSRQQGRFVFYILGYFWALPMFFPSVWMTKLYLMLLTTADLLVFGRFLYRYVDKRFAFAAMALIAATLQISDQHNLLVSYSFLHYPFILLVLSAGFQLDYYRKKGYWRIVVSALLSFGACLFQEGFLMFYVFSFAVAMWHGSESGLFQRVRASLWQLKFHVLGGAVWLALYFGFRWMYPSQYSGNSLCLTQPLTSLQVLASFMTGMLPGRTAAHVLPHVDVAQLVSYLGALDILYIAAGVAIVCWLLARCRPFRIPAGLPLGLLLCAVLSCCLHAVSQQYVAWMQEGNTYSYVPSYQSGLFLTVLLALLAVWLLGKARGRAAKRTGLVLMGVLLLCVMTATSMTNRYYDGIFKQKADHYESYRSFFASGVLESLPEDAQILLDDPYPVETETVALCATTVHYQPLVFSKKPAELDPEKPVYRLVWSEQGLVLQEEPD